MTTQITVSKLSSAELAGDWHDRPLRWIVNGPNNEAQKFSTKREAQSYKSIRSNTATEAEAHRQFINS